MSWVRLDDRWDMNSKLERAAEQPGVGDSAWALWSRADTQCNRELTDGRIAGATLRARTRNKKPQIVIDALVRFKALHDEAGRLSCSKCLETHAEPLESDEYLVHDYLDWNPCRENVEALRDKKREAASKGGTASGQTRRRPPSEPPTPTKNEARCFDSGSTLANRNEPPRTEVLSSPLLSSPSGSSNTDHPEAAQAARGPSTKSRGTRCPDPLAEGATSWLLLEKLPPLSDEEHGAEVESFMNYWCSVTGQRGTKLNWAATWRNHVADDRHPRKVGPAPRFRRRVDVGSVPETDVPVTRDPSIQRIIDEQRAERRASGLPETPPAPVNATNALLSLIGAKP